MVKAAGADDLIDMVVPRSRIPEYLRRMQELSAERGSKVFGCGHAGPRRRWQHSLLGL
jgi:glycolate oxidase